MEKGYWVAVTDHYIWSGSSGMRMTEENREWMVFIHPKTCMATGHGKTREEAMEDFIKAMKALKPLGSRFVPEPETRGEVPEWYERHMAFIPESTLN